ncbi:MULTISPECIES: hypothetical protein [Desulfosediminicola]|uniref:hypothetical protein n=1 Tax=Desulfosediminicola TaxID=2886823 RepID=UPI0010AC76D9|nr:hypothetical protein [Desulfosediminicola ganghwensis]
MELFGDTGSVVVTETKELFLKGMTELPAFRLWRRQENQADTAAEDIFHCDVPYHKWLFDRS